jgi:hypothetical protein
MPRRLLTVVYLDDGEAHRLHVLVGLACGARLLARLLLALIAARIELGVFGAGADDARRGRA